VLVLTRRLGESITIGDQIRVVVLEVRGSQVRLGIEAPPSIPIHREEVYRRILEENREAARVPFNNLDRLIQTWQRVVPSRKAGHEGSDHPIRRD